MLNAWLLAVFCALSFIHFIKFMFIQQLILIQFWLFAFLPDLASLYDCFPCYICKAIENYCNIKSKKESEQSGFHIITVTEILVCVFYTYIYIYKIHIRKHCKNWYFFFSCKVPFWCKFRILAKKAKPILRTVGLVRSCASSAL